MSRWGNRVVIKNGELIIMRMIKGVLFLSILAAGSFGAPGIVDIGNYPFQSMLSRLSQGNLQTPRLQKSLSKMGALKWVQIGSTHYSNNTFSGNPVVWTLTSRDTIIYDADGNAILWKTSSAHTGWATDSLQILASEVYAGGIFSEIIFKSFSNYNDTLRLDFGRHDTVAWFNGGKILVENMYEWNDSKKTWIPAFKDSLIFSAPAGNSYLLYEDLTNIVGRYSYNFDTTNSSWRNTGSFVKIDSECNATTLTLGGKGLLNYTADSLIDIKAVFIYKSSVWTRNNLTQYTELRKNPSTGTYYDFYKQTYSFDANGYITSYQVFDWDSTIKSLVCMWKNLYFPDSRGNDTLSLDCYYDTSTLAWDTISMYRYARTYDANGNNLITVLSYYDTYNKIWSIDYKDVNTFAQINSQILRLVQPAIKPDISVVTTATRIIVTAPNITGLMLYNASGRMVASIKQQAAGSISLKLSNRGVPISSGIYIVKLMRGKEQSSFKLSIQR
jgi:hypothetical protein